MKKILVINTVGYNYDGITSVILNYLKGMDREGLSFFFTAYEDVLPNLRQDLENLGTVLTVPNRKQTVKAYAAQLYRILGTGYDVIHIHGNSGTMVIETVLAKLRGVRKIIVHGHSTSTNHPLVNAVMKYPMMLLADECVACSGAAGKWLYGNRPYTVLNNAIDLAKFRFDPKARTQYREEFGVEEGAFLIGHIGHFTAPKNHVFLLDVFASYRAMDPKARLLLIGDGADFEQVKEKAEQLSLSESVVFAGRRSDAAAIYSAMDLFLLPSKWEGLPLTMVEAQSNGLPALVSDVVTAAAKCTDRVFYKALSDGPDSWAEALLALKAQGFRRMEDLSESVQKHGFDIHREAENLRKIYIR